MSGQSLQILRKEVLKSAQGKVLEIGFGTGLNLPYYPTAVETLTVVEPNDGMNAIATKRIQNSPITVNSQILSGEALPMADASFDTVVCTWTLCSIPKVDQAVQEIYRVLKPGGKFLFIEHGLSPEAEISAWQHRLTPLQKRIGEGCHLDRPIKAIVSRVFEIVEVKEFYAEDMPKVVGYFYQGIGTKDY